VLNARVKSPKGKLVQQCPYNPRLYHFSLGAGKRSGTKREKRGIRPEQSAVLRRESWRASVDAMQRPIGRGPVFRQMSMAREGVSGTTPAFFPILPEPAPGRRAVLRHYLHVPRKSFDPGLWGFAEDPGNEYIQLPPFPSKKEACPRYRAEFPHCVMMSRNYRHERDYP